MFSRSSVRIGDIVNVNVLPATGQASKANVFTGLVSFVNLTKYTTNIVLFYTLMMSTCFTLHNSRHIYLM